MGNINLNEYITLNQGITSEEGLPVYEAISAKLAKGEKVTLDFEGVTFLTTAFLNTAIGALYKDYTSEQLQANLHLVHYTPETAVRIKKVTENAKSFYEDEARFKQSVEEVLNGSM